MKRTFVLAVLVAAVQSGCGGGGGGGGSAGDPPLAPGGLTAQAVSATSIALAWSDLSSDETGFTVERSGTSSSSGFAEVASLAAGATSWADSGLAPGTASWYRVRAFNAHGVSPYSNVVYATTQTEVPAPPVALNANAQSPTEILLAWSPGSVGQTGFAWSPSYVGQTGFVVERSSTSATTGYADLVTVAGTATSHLDAGLAADTPYWYRVRAVYPYGSSAPSSPATATTWTPAPPFGATANAQSPTEILLAWSPSYVGQTGFVVERSSTSATTGYADLVTVAGTATSHLDAGLAADTPYWYRVRAVYPYGTSVPSNPVTATTWTPAPPFGITANAQGPTEILLAWSPSYVGQTGFVVERSSTSATTGYAHLVTVPGTATSHLDAGLAAYTPYWYRVRAVYPYGTSVPSDPVTALTWTPAPPYGAYANAQSPTEILLAWSPGSVGQTSFVVERSSTSATTGYADLVTVPGTATSHLDAGLAADTPYWYRVRAVYPFGTSVPSNPATATTWFPAPPFGVTANAQGPTEILLAWSPGYVGQTSFVVERSGTSATTGYADQVTVAGTATSHLDAGLAADTPYWYRVRAVYPYGTSVPSDPATATTGPGPTLPPDPSTVASAIDPSVATDFHESTRFLSSGPSPIQTGVADGTIDPDRAAVLRGQVRRSDGAPASGATIAVLGHPELGQTLSRADGRYDLVVNGGGPLTVSCSMAGFLPAQRQVEVPWKTFVAVPDMVLLGLDPVSTVVQLGSSTPIQVARGSVVADGSGTRQATLLVPAGTAASLVLPGGATIPLDSLTVRATEYTVGTSGPDAMPAHLPPSSGYTYAVELSADEALAAGAVDVRFDRPLPFYVEDFLGFPVGSAVPAGYLDRERGLWIASQNGRVVRILAITGGRADLDADGDGQADAPSALAALGVSDAEREQLASLYPRPPTQLWRVPVAHFTPWDCNWPYGPPPDAEPPAQPPPQGDDTDDEFTIECASLVEAQNQVLGEAVPIPGTPYALHYQSDRAPARLGARSFVISLTGGQVPPSLAWILLRVTVAGQIFEREYAPAPNLTHVFTWDGLDAYRRPIQGAQSAQVTIFYGYPAFYYPVPADFSAAFARFSPNRLSPVQARMAVVLSQRFRQVVRASAAFAQPVAGWSLDVHHAVDPDVGLLLGDGGRRSLQTAGNPLRGVATVAGASWCDHPSPDGTPATQVCLRTPYGLGFGADGRSYFIADTGHCVVRLVDGVGLATTEAGYEDACGYLGDGGLAWMTPLNHPTGGLVTDSGGLIVDRLNHRIRAVDWDGIIRTAVGTGVPGFSGDGGPAEAAQLNLPRAAAMAPDGSLYLADSGNHRVRRVSPGGLIETVAGTGVAAYGGDGGSGRSATLSTPSGLAIGPDGSVLIADTGNQAVRRLRPDGVLVTVAGGNGRGLDGDGGPATLARLDGPQGVAVASDGTLFIADTGNHAIRVVSSDGLIRTLAGTGVAGSAGDGGLARNAALSGPASIALAGDGSVYVADTGNDRIRRIANVVSDTAISGSVASADGSQRYQFDLYGRHVRTIWTATGAVRHEFGYDAEGRLVSVADGDGNLTALERDPAGRPTAIVAPNGQRTLLGVNGQGLLESITRPGGEATRFGYAPGGLLTSVTDPADQVRSFLYDPVGRLIRDVGPSGDFLALARTTRASGFEVATSTGAGPLARLGVTLPAAGGSVRTDAGADGRVLTQAVAPDGTRTVTRPDGTTITTVLGPDPRFGVQSPIVVEQTIRTPAGLVNTYRRELTVTPAPAGDPVGYTALHSVRSVNGRRFTLEEDAVRRQAIATSAGGRTIVVDYDAQGRVVRRQRGDLAPTGYARDWRGRVASVTRGEGLGARQHVMSYDAGGFLESLAYPDGAQVGYRHDASGRVIGQVFPDGREAAFGRDPRGRVVSYAPPGRPAQGLVFGADGLLVAQTLPDVGQGVATLALERGVDGLPLRRTLADGTTVDLTHDAARRLVRKVAGADQVAITYHPTSGLLASITRTGAGSLSFAYDGFLRTRTAWQGPVPGGVTLAFDGDFRVTSQTVDGTPPVAFGYDADGLLTSAGALTVSRSATNGLPVAAAIGDVAETWLSSAFGEPVERRVSFRGGELYAASYVFDALGRVTLRTEAVLGEPPEVTALAYDPAGRLREVTRDGTIVASYTFDENGNRVAASGPSGGTAASYDARDQLLSHGAATFGWTPNGQLARRTEGGSTTTYAYDAFGALTGVSRAGAPTVQYLVDGVGLRIGRLVGGLLVQGFVHDAGRRVIAELDGAGQVVSRFVRGVGRGAPDYMVRGGRTYRIVSDHVGSPRLVVDVASGAVAQRLEFGPFGEVLLDTSPGFQPFGFAGGLLDPDTGLTHFDARDYDAATGRFLTRDPLGPASGGANAYLYAFGDPVSWVDRSGRVDASWNGDADYMDEVPPGTVERIEDPETGDYREVGKTEDGVDFDRSCYAGTCTEVIWDDKSKTSGETQYSSDCEGAGCGDSRERNARAQEQMEDIDPSQPGPAPPAPPPAPPSPPSPGQPGSSPGSGSPGGGAAGAGVCSMNIWRDSNGNVIARVAVPQ
ncbi:MAG: fibronectin type III domain-containing protein [Anaeromyxobacter sp.]|nr:fibronectin type III domain-containing protein [Anaeromyxobacter sp.]